MLRAFRISNRLLSDVAIQAEKRIGVFARNMVTSFPETLYTAFNAWGYKIVAERSTEECVHAKGVTDGLCQG